MTNLELTLLLMLGACAILCAIGWHKAAVWRNECQEWVDDAKSHLVRLKRITKDRDE